MLPLAESLAVKGLRAVKWNYIGTMVRVVAQFAAQIAMARMLGPEVIGSFGYALLLSGILGLLIDQGLGWAVVHASSVTERELHIVFVRVMLIAILCAVCTYIWAAPIATLMGGPSAEEAIRFSAPVYLFIGLNVITQAKLRKELRFREIQLSQMTSYVVAYPLVGVSLAAGGAGIWSLVTAYVLQAALGAFLMLRYVPHSFGLANPFGRLHFGGYSRDIASINLVNWAVDNMATAFIGRTFGPAALGLYNTALGLVRVPANHLVVNIQTVLFPTAAATKDHLPSLRRLFRTSLAAVLAVAVPAFGFIAVASDAVIEVLLGPTWSAAAMLLPPIALAMIPHMISSITGSTLSGRGDQKIELASQAMTAVLLFLAYFALPLSSLLSVSWLFCGLYCLRAVFLLKAAMRQIQLDICTIISVLRGPLIVSGIGSALYNVVASLEFLSPQSLLAVGVLIFVAAKLLLILVFPQALIDQSIFDLLMRYREKYVLLNWFLARVNNKIAPAA